MKSDNNIDTSTSTKSEGIIQSICNCGCSTLTVPYHLKDKQLWIRFYPPKWKDTVSFTLVIQDVLPAPDDMGWKVL